MEQTKKQTPVDWLVEQLTKNPLPQSKDEFIDGDLVDIINKAKEMENSSTSTASGMNPWNPPQFVSAKEVGESIEMIFTQTSMYSRTGGMSPYHDERAVKIIYSCKDGKWNKSKPIYGKIVPAQEECYEFED